ncbi:LytTR family DNA-binding domain-containing protein [Sphingosinicella ginsenosidimutans]|uniref:Response regulator transcription factor n=1 Tax=Allosphingosinicella ginsenosidimutans TaxID=1176539 RepID=A0A5C6TXJ6_9SPHN|nr:LytTR family DNA-binding domain-containing protein [Sphingosinicella ginsenosidimutans]TXC64498.1 response regulator transcription factor [Sphingosinicella ginsenosidimutans]
MTPLRVFMCDDEPLALDRLRGMLEGAPGVELVGEALNGRELLDRVLPARPDLVFLDIEMPQLDGFDLIHALARLDWPGEPPLIVFVTAHREHAAEAFDSGALDFINKPVRMGRLELTLSRARTALERTEAQRRMTELLLQIEELKNLGTRSGDDSQIWVRTATGTAKIDMRAVEWIEAEGEYVRLHVGAVSHLRRGSLSDAATEFGPLGFLRVHRSAAVNTALVAALEKGSWGNLLLRMESGAAVAVGKKYRGAVQAMIAGPAS